MFVTSRLLLLVFCYHVIITWPPNKILMRFWCLFQTVSSMNFSVFFLVKLVISTLSVNIVGLALCIFCLKTSIFHPPEVGCVFRQVCIFMKALFLSVAWASNPSFSKIVIIENEVLTHQTWRKVSVNSEFLGNLFLSLFVDV